MALLGRAAVAMWWDMASAYRDEFQDWHSHEHFPERLGIPGFLRGSRWADADGGPGFFILYELDSYETLTSPHYLAKLNQPTPWSVKMMPHHSNMVRSQCRILSSFGGGIGLHTLTLRFGPTPGSDATLGDRLDAVLADLVRRPGLTGAHRLHTQTPPAAMTEEQKIRGGRDGVADWIVLLQGYDAAAVATAGQVDLAPTSLTDWGARAEQTRGHYQLCLAATPADMTALAPPARP